MAQANSSSSSTDHGETGSSNHMLLLYNYTSHCPQLRQFSMSIQSFSSCTKLVSPPDKWRSLASGLKMATAVPIIDADCRTSVGKLQELIRTWVQGSNTTGNQWVMLIDAVVMCDEPAVAQELATAVGCPLARSGTTTQHV